MTQDKFRGLENSSLFGPCLLARPGQTGTAGFGESCRPGPQRSVLAAQQTARPGPHVVLLIPRARPETSRRLHYQPPLAVPACDTGHMFSKRCPETGVPGDIISDQRSLSLPTSINICVSSSTENLIRLLMTPATFLAPFAPGCGYRVPVSTRFGLTLLRA